MESAAAVAALQRKSAAAGYAVHSATIGGRDAVVAHRSDFRLRWLATRLYTYVVVFAAPDLDDGLAKQLTEAAQDYAITHKGGLARGLQTGIAVVAVFLSDAIGPETRSWFSRRPKARFAALSFPVLADLGSGQLTYFAGHLRVGFIYSNHLHAVTRDLVEAALKSLEP